ncbi:MAG: hypothetical protein U1F63_12525 [Chitinivorax sp.]
MLLVTSKARRFCCSVRLLDIYIAVAKAAAATARRTTRWLPLARGDTTGGYNAPELLNTTQKAVVAATLAVNGVYDQPNAVPAGTQTIVTNLTGIVRACSLVLSHHSLLLLHCKLRSTTVPFSGVSRYRAVQCRY